MTHESHSLRLYIDSARIEDWERYLATGIFYGVTTNPALLRQAGFEFTIEDHARLAQASFDHGSREIHMQVWGRELGALRSIGEKLAAIDPRVTVKVPINPPGVLCARELIESGVNVTLTAVHSAQQVLIAIALGARYAAPYLGRMADAGMDGLAEVTRMGSIVAAMESPLRLLVASIRQTSDLVALAECGLNTFTLRPPLIDDLLQNELTRRAVEVFEEAAGKV